MVPGEPENSCAAKIDVKVDPGMAAVPDPEAADESSFVFPVTFAQQRLLFLDQLDPNSTSYSVPWSIRITGKLDANALERSLNEIVRRHEILRTTFDFVNGRPVQMVAGSPRVPLVRVDLTADEDREKAAQSAAMQEARTPLDLRNGPLVRTKLLELGPEEHVLLFTTHHIAFDGWSRRILVNDLAALYDAFCDGHPSPLQELPLQYADYAVWQRDYLQGERLEKLLSYWSQQLAGAPATIDLPTDRPRPAIQSFRGAAKSFVFSGTISTEVLRASRRLGTTPFMTLLAGFQSLLARYSGQNDIVVGAPIANRNRAEVEEMIGFFANTLVMRTDLSGNPSFRELLQRVKDTALGAYAHQDMPFERLVEELRPERSLSYNPLFQVLFSLQNAPRRSFDLRGLQLQPLAGVVGNTAKFDLSFFLLEAPDGFTARVEYNTDLFDGATIERMLQHYQCILEAALAHPDSRISELSVLTLEERQRILVEWNATDAEYPREFCLHQWFEQYAARTPDAVACVFDKEHLTYEELNKRANQLAHYLKKRGVGPGQRVGIFVERSLDMMVGLLGIQKSGAAYVPLDPYYPAERIRTILDDAQVPILLTQQALLEALPPHAADVICLDSDWPQIGQESSSNLVCSARPEDLVYVIYTSGSTGKPKGVQVPHRAVVNLLHSMAHELSMGPDDVFPALASFAFDMCIPELYLALVTGGRVVVARREMASNGEELAALLRETGATVVHATPTTWSLLLEAGFTGQGLKRAIGAEPLPRELCSRLLEADSSLYNFYGPTETTVWSAFHHFQSSDEPVVLGRPLANTQIYILDKELQPVPIGVLGEIHIGGDGVTCGYLNLPEPTAEKFIADRFASQANARMYKTGDLGRFLPDGRIEFMGRIDHQVKIRGFRIELGEIETVLARHVAVQDCVVIAREDVAGDKRLVGYVVPAAGRKVNAAELRNWVKERLPEYMVPVAWVETPSLPLTPNGKVDRKNLPAPEYQRAELAGEYQEARTPAEEVMAGIWAEVLKLDRVGVHDQFFELGGHSLLATQVVSRIRHAFQVELPLRALFEAPTVAELAERVEALQREEQGLLAPPIVPVPRTQRLPLSFAQQRLWFLDQLDPNNPRYNVPHAARLKGHLQPEVLKRSLNEIVRRHETLRTSFHLGNDEPVQIIGPIVTVPLVIRDLTSLPEASREEEARRLAREEAQRPFDLTAAPLMRATLLKLADGDHVLLLNTHHIISDGWSLGVLLREMASLYESFAANSAPTLPELAVQYADFAVWQREFLTGEILDKQLAYWKQQLAGAPASLDLPTDNPRPPVESSRGALQAVVLPKELLDSLRKFSRNEGVTLFMTLLAAFDVLLSRYSGQQDVVVGTPIAGRNRAEVEKLIGFFANTLVLRTDLSGDPSFRELLARVRETAMGAYAHQDLPFEKLVEELNPERDLSRNPLVQVMIVLQNLPTEGTRIAELETTPFATGTQSAKLDLMLVASEVSQGLRTAIVYNTDLFEAETIQHMLGHFQRLLEAAVAAPAAPVFQMPLLAAEEHQQIVVEWNKTDREFPGDHRIHELIREQAERTPEAVAVVFENSRLTYGELNRRANQLAHFLRARGVGPETLVGVYLERSLEMVVAVLAVLKAGGAYVPLDPSYPKERLSYILDDARAHIVLTQCSLAGDLPISGEQICLDLGSAGIAAESELNPVGNAGPHDLAYVLFTSGSTGKPKGCQIEHESLFYYLQWANGYYFEGPDEGSFPLFTSLAFDLTVTSLFLPLLRGRTLRVYPQDMDVEAILTHIFAGGSGVDCVKLTPSHVSLLEQLGLNATTVVLAIVGGEAFQRSQVQLLQGLNSRMRIINEYGPTETTVGCVVKHVLPEEDRVLIGRPIDNTRIYILDPRLNPVPVGVPGEIYIASPSVARGYLNRDDLNQEVFLESRFPPNDRMYKTGDLGRWLPDGNIDLIGRIDSQVKIRGFRIELGEIEAVLEQHPAVNQAVVVAREDTPGDKRLVAYVVAAPASLLDFAVLRNWVKAQLPEYMVPAAWVEMPSLPLTPNGKVDRKNLPTPEYQRAELAGEYQEARTPAEEVMAGIWAEVLKLDRVGIHDQFFELGGHSLLATQVVSRIRQAFQVELPLRALFEAPTVAELAERVEALQREEQGLLAPPIAPVPRTAPLPLSFAQQRLWFLDQLEPNNPRYNVPHAARLKGHLQPEVLERSLQEIVRRHESLRTSFQVVGDQPVQIIDPEVTVPLVLRDLTSLPEARREEEARRLAREEAQRPFDLTIAPLMRATLLKLAEDDHVLLLNTHHIISDGWSLGVLLREMASLYEAFSADGPSSLPELAVQYADFAAWQREFLAGEILDKQLAYWKEQLSGAPPSLELPTDRPRPPIESFRGAQQAIVLPKELLESLRKLSRVEGVTLYMTLLAAFAVLLSRYSGQQDVVVGTPIAGRNRAEVEKLIGFFVNTLVMRTDLSDDPSFSELLVRVRETAMGAYAHQDLPFEKLVEELRPDRDLSRNPLFQVMLILQNLPTGSQKLGDIDVTPFGTGLPTAKFDLTLIASEVADGLRISMVYNTDLFDAATIEHLLRHFGVLLEGVIQDPEIPASKAPLLTSEEQHKLLVEFNQTAVDFPQGIRLHDFVAQQALKTPDATALVCGEEAISYRDLNTRANRLANYLVQRGAGPEVLIGIHSERSVAMLVAILGVLKAGSAYVPLDPMYPRERISHILEDAGALLVLTQESIVDDLPAFGGQCILLDRGWPEISQESAAEPSSGVSPSNLAYVLFTSGSTGRPKGVAIEHQSAATFVYWAQQAFRPEQLAGVLLSTSICFDLSIFEMFVPLSVGGKVIIADNALLLPSLPAKNEVTLINTVPSAMAELLRMNGVPESVNTVNLAGEALPETLVEQIYANTKASQVYNLYGPTEDTTYSTYTLVPSGARVTIGRPIANSQAYILDAERKPVPIGVPGELYLAGAGLARGYYGRADLTSERFVANPFANDLTARMYRTGDLARFLPDGDIDYLGRIDHQVKLRGFRIELGEIETVLLAHPAVERAVVVVREDTPGDKRLVAYLVAASASMLDFAVLRNWVREQLPEYMVPVAWVEMPSLPLTPNGKVDRKNLPAPEYQRAELAGEYQEARTPAEEVMAGIWAEVLKLDRVGIHDQFFELGGHSLLATQVVSRIRHAFQVELPLRALFEAPTVAELAERVEALQREEQGLLAPPIVPVPRTQRLPLSFAQQRLWFLDQLEPNSSSYNVPHVVRMRGHLQVEVLERSLNEIVRRHETLRTAFRMLDSEPVQLITPELRLPLPVVDLTDWPESERENEARRLTAEEIARPFDLSVAPLLRATLLRLADHDHILVLNTHHVISDRWSLGVLSQELAGLYEAFAADQPSRLPELPVQYADYAVWQRDFLAGETLDKQLAYWKQQLSGAPASVDLPTDHPRPPMQNYRGAQRSIHLGKDLLDRLRELGRSHGATLFMTLLAAFDVLLSRYSGQQDVVIGTPIAGRNRAEVEKLIGFFVNTLVMRTDLSDDPSFSELLSRVRETAMGAYAHQDLPFEKLVEELKPDRDLSRNPLFQVMLILQNLPTGSQKLGDIDVTPFGAGLPSAKLDITLVASEVANGLRVSMVYSTDLFDAATIERMLRHFEVLLEGVIEDPATRVSKASLLTSEEQHKLLVEWNATEAEYPRQSCLHQLLEEQAGRRPESVAVEFEGHSLSYAELDKRSNQLARLLRKRGVGPDRLVGVCMERSLEMVVALLGILKAGGAYVPLDPAYPSDRIQYVLDDARVMLLLTQESLLASLPTTSAEIHCLDPDWRALEHEDSGPVTAEAKPENLAYVIYTSGSTGKPKGVQLEHRSVVNFLTSMRREPGMGADDVLVAVTTLSFDIAGLELYLPLLTGAKVVVASREATFDGRLLRQLLEHSGATLMQATPTTWRLLLESGWQGDHKLKVLVGGEALPLDLAHNLATRCGSVWNMYGPTETTIWSSVYRVEGTDETLVPIGRPIANTTFYILDGTRQPVVEGAVGELYIGGDGLARGYFERDDLTAEKFVPDPFSSQPGARLYRTGDLARYRQDGVVEFLGRIDHQVKLRGFRIELGEIETVLLEHPDVERVVVVAREDTPGDKRLVAYVVAAPASLLDFAVLRNWVKAQLPEYMVPAAWVEMPSLPLTPNGKVDRKNLPTPEYQRAELAGEYQEARTPAEEVMAGIWAEVLKLDRVGIHDQFFELGGHSLLATQVVSRIRQAFQVELPLRALFEAPTVAELAERVEALQREEQGLLAPPIAPVPRTAPLPLSFAQQRLWFLDQLEPNNPRYNVPHAARLKGHLQPEVLERSLQEIVRRHESLRTSFQVVGDQPVQIIDPEVTVPLVLRDLTSLPEARREEEARRLAREEAQRPFDLTIAPLMRATLLKLAEDDHVLLLNTHHIISDGWSLGVLLREMASLYEAFSADGPSSLPELAVQYADFAAWQREFLAGEILDKQLAYWKEQLSGAPPSLELPTDRPRPPIESFRGAQQAIVLPKELLESLRKLSRVEGVTLYMTLLAAFAVLLSRYSGQQDVVVGTPIAGRNRAEVEKLIGFFANTLVLRTDLSSGPTFRELLARVRQTAMGAFAHQDLPFEKLVEELRPERDLSRNPLIQVIFALQNVPTEGTRIAGIETTPFSTGTQSAKLDLTLAVTEVSEGLRTAAVYNTDLFDGATIERMLRHYQVLLEGALANPELRLSQLPLLTNDEQQLLLSGWNATQTEYPSQFCLHQWFEQYAARTPDAVACVFDKEHLTYEELNKRANQLAHYLKKRGVGPGQRVGIFVERSLDMMVGLLGIQKSGAAYVPLDPYYPAERIRTILDDAQVPILLTQQALLEALPPHAADVICLDSDWPQIGQESSSNLVCSARPEDLVYVIYTSGSTGKPKGVQVPHRAVVNLLHSMAHELSMGPDDVFPALASFAFDMCIPELYLALVTGGRVVVARREMASNGEELAALLRETGATVVHATPTTWSLLLEAGFTGQGLKRAIGAEPLPRELCSRLLEADSSLYNFYGPTETTVWSAFHHFQSSDEPVVLGRPLANTQIYILDKELQPVPIGVLGEIHIGGDGVTCGYLNLPEPTAEKFIADRFASQANARMYKTGDLGRFLPDGRIEFMGRIDHQVKIRGFRIELGEIETVLARHVAVQDCVVIAREDVAGDKRLVGYVVPAAGRKVNAAELRNWVKERLPEYMVPVAWVEMPSLPLTPNGKVDRKNLPAPEYQRAELAGEYQEARTPAEEVMAGIWAEVLKLDRVGIHDQFFELGGHSLLATQVVSRIRHAFQVELPLRALFEAPTVAELAERVEALQREEQGLLAPPIVPVPRTQRLPLSFAQQRLWFLDQLEPNSSSYNVPHVVRMRGHLQVEVLERSLNEIVRRHETLRTAFRMLDSEPVQLITPELRLPLPVVDLTDWPESERENEARRLTAEEIARPFDLSVAPLLRATLLRLADHDHILVLNTHHVISDRWSLGVLSQELAGLYEAFAADQPSRLPELPVQYADYAVWQRDFLAGETLDKQLAYWKQQLSGAPASVDLPTDHPRPPMQSYRGAQRSIHLGKDLLDRLRELGRSHGATLFMTLLAAFDVLLSRYSGQQDVVIGTPIAGRNRAEVEKLIGFFVNTLVMRTDLSDDPSFSELLSRVRETAMGAYAHQDLPFEKLVEELKPDRDLSRNPLFQVMLVLQNQPTASQKLGDIDVTSFGAGLPSANFDITLVASEVANGLRVSIVYSTDLFDAATIERMLRHFEVLLEGVIEDPATRVSKASLLTSEEQHKLLVEWNATEAEYPRQSCLHQLLEEQAGRRPESVAVEFEGHSLSYAELDKRSNQLARLLRKRGVGPDRLVGVCMERSLEMVVALLGILKAGGAYVPLDPAYPSDRIQYVLDDARVMLLLTQESLLASLPTTSAEIHCLDPDWRALEHEDSGPVTAEAKPENLAYVIYTSGSTGKPKGVQLEHRSVVNFLTSMRREPGMGADDVLVAVTTLSFDIAGLELYLPLLTGAKVVVASREATFDGRLLRQLLEHSGATLMQATPTTWRLLLESGWQGDHKLKVLVGGEALPLDLAHNLATRCGSVWNMYGPTETTIWSSVYRVEGTDETLVPIGRPIANTTFYILDGTRQPVVEGAVGELYIGGDGLARGYFERDDLTAEKFVPDPFSSQPGARLYRTGDLARYRQDGVVEFLGRIDHQVKLRGFRIELGEIETVLLEHPDVERVVVVAREDRPGDKRLVAYIVPKVGSDIDIPAIQTHLERIVPAYMVPSAFVKLGALPMTDNGKVNRRALPLPDWSRDEARDRKAPADQFELMLVRVWERVLGVSGIGVDDNFFDLGGHSLLAVRLLSEVEKVVGRKVPLASLFRGATVASQSKLLREGAEADPEPLVMEYQGGQPGNSPFFAIAAPGVRSLGYALLGRNLGENQPFYKLQAPGPVVDERPLNSGELCELAQQYIAGMRAVQPEGPYYIAAMCGGCQIAEQMILQLESQGQKVALFAIFDTWVLEHAHGRWGWRLFGVQQRLRWLSRASVSEQFEWAQRAVSIWVQVWTGKRKASQPWADAYWPQDFKPPHFQAPVILFKRPKQPYYYVDDPTMGWGPRTEGGIQIYEIAAKHHEFLREPHTELVGKIIMSRLKTYRTNAEDPGEACESRDAVTTATVR